MANNGMTAEQLLILEAIETIEHRIKSVELDIEVWAGSGIEREHCNGMLIGYRVSLREMKKVMDIISDEI